MTTETTVISVPTIEIDIDAVDELKLKEVYIEDERKADRFEHEDASASVNIWRQSK